MREHIYVIPDLKTGKTILYYKHRRPNANTKQYSRVLDKVLSDGNVRIRAE